MERDILAEVQEKCQQYWNQSGICDAEVHAILSFINGRAIDAAATITALRERVTELEHGMFVASRMELSGKIPTAFTDEEIVKYFAPWWTKRDTAGLTIREVRLLETIVDRNITIANRVVTCAFCGHSFPDGTPVTQDRRLTDHVMVCPKHPMRQTEADNARLREALEEALEPGVFGEWSRCPDPRIDDSLRKLCELHGYGAVMHHVEWLWSERSRLMGLDGSEHTVAACASVRRSWIKKARQALADTEGSK